MRWFVASGPIISQALSEFAMLNEVDYLLIAKPVALNQLKIRRDCVWFLVNCADCW
jgi:hypothetical protein